MHRLRRTVQPLQKSITFPASGLELPCLNDQVWALHLCSRYSSWPQHSLRPQIWVVMNGFMQASQRASACNTQV
jgi:hypothetical protein